MDTRPRHLPGIEASSLPSPRQGRDSSTEVGPTSLYTEVGIPTSVFCPKNPSPGQRRRSVSDAILAAPLTECFFTTHTPSRQSWRGHRIAPLNPGVGTGLPEKPITGPAPKVRELCCPCSITPGVFFSIHTPCRQSWRGHRIASLNPGVGAGLPRCLPENSGSASPHRDALPDSPPGLPGKLRQRPAV